jgi:hypothetical protein
MAQDRPHIGDSDLEYMLPPDIFRNVIVLGSHLRSWASKFVASLDGIMEYHSTSAEYRGL